jgi:hypothetical protein
MPDDTLNKDMNILLSLLPLKPAQWLGIGLLSEPYMVHLQASGWGVTRAREGVNMVRRAPWKSYLRARKRGLLARA